MREGSTIQTDLRAEGLVVRKRSLPGKDGAWLVENAISPQELEKREAAARQRVADIQKRLQNRDAIIFMRLRFYYESLDRSLTNRSGIRSGYWPQGWYFHVCRIEGAELDKLRRIMEHLAPVPLNGRPLRFVRKTADANSHAELSLGSPFLSILNPREEIVKKSQESVAMQQMSMDDERYSLPDADYDAFMALPSIRKSYALMNAYRHRPADCFISEEEDYRRRQLETITEKLPQLSTAQVMLNMYYPRLDSQKKLPLLAPPCPPRFWAHVKMSAAEMAQLRDIVSRLKPAPMRYLVPFTAAPRKRDMSDDDGFQLDIRLSFADQSNYLSDIIHSIIRLSELKTAPRLKYGDRVCWVLPDADYDALMAMPSIRQALEWKDTYKNAPANFFTRETP